MTDPTPLHKAPPALPRRRFLGRAGALLALGLAAPVLGLRGTARADDDGDDGDDGGGGGGGDGSGGPVRTTRQAPRRRKPPANLPEVVILLPAGASAAPAFAVGYLLLGQTRIAALDADLMRLRPPAGRDIPAAVAEVSALLPAALADANHLYTTNSFKCSGPACDAQAMIGWSGWPGAFAPRIGMIDTGVNTGHDALAGQKLTVHQPDLEGRAPAGRAHGTAIAALLIGRADSATPGLLPLAELVAVEAFHASDGAERADAYALIAAMDVLLDAGVGVINLSFSGPANLLFGLMIRRAYQTGVGVVAAAGNGGPGAPAAYPAAWPEVVAVTALDSRGRPYRQANRGPYISLAAPGVNLWTAALSGGRARSGTSYAAPFVTAALAVERHLSPEAPLREAIVRILGCADDLGAAGFDEVFGHGLLSAPGICAPAGSKPFALSGD